MNKCPNCGFESQQQADKCPKCGTEFQFESTSKSDENIHNETIKNDDIQWSDYKDVPLGEVIDQLQPLSADDDKEVESDESIVYEDNPILAAYLKAHKEGRHLELQDEIEQIIRKQQSEEVAKEKIKEEVEEGQQGSDTTLTDTPIDGEFESVDLDEESEKVSLENESIKEQDAHTVSDLEHVSQIETTDEVEEKEQLVQEQEVELLSKDPIESEELTNHSLSVDSLEENKANEPITADFEDKESLEKETDPVKEELTQVSEAMNDEATSTDSIEEGKVSEENLLLAANSAESDEVNKTSEDNGIIMDGGQPAPTDTKEIESFAETLEKAKIRKQEDQTKTGNSQVNQASLSTDNSIEEKEPLAEATVSKSEATEQPKERKSKKKYMYTAAALGILAIAGGSYHYIAVQQAAQEKRDNDRALKGLAETTKQVQALFINEENQFLKASTTLTNIEKLQTTLDQYKTVKGYADSEKLLTQAKDTFQKVEQLNQQFTSPILVEDKLQADVHVKDVETAKFDSLAGASSFATLYNQAVSQGEADIAKAKIAMATADELASKLKEGKLDASVTQVMYDNALKQVNQLVDTSLKTTYLKKIEPVKAALDKKATEEAAAKLQAEQQAAQAKAQAQAKAAQDALIAKITANTTFSEASQVLSASTPQNAQNKPIIASRKSDLQNTASSAWNWAPGIYDFVINRSIARGYIVSGGFYLERVRIENGEGYYNLYATSTNSKLLSGYDNSVLPMYIATINAKTGYFKGNGTN